MNKIYEYIVWFSIFSTGLGCGVYAGIKISDNDREGLRERLQNAVKERDEWQKRHADLMQQWEREKRPRPFRESPTPPENHVMHLDHSCWGEP